jgi:hypothetical protein
MGCRARRQKPVPEVGYSPSTVPDRSVSLSRSPTAVAAAKTTRGAFKCYESARRPVVCLTTTKWEATAARLAEHIA